jgi:hypothetical protein
MAIKKGGLRWRIFVRIENENMLKLFDDIEFYDFGVEFIGGID